jgi:hypothetical protein
MNSGGGSLLVAAEAERKDRSGLAIWHIVAEWRFDKSPYK